MEDRNSEGYAVVQDIEDTLINDNGDVHYDFRVYGTLEAAEAQALEHVDQRIVFVNVTIEVCAPE